MRLCMLLLGMAVLLWGTGARAQEALTITTPPGKPVVWDPTPVIPEHNPATEVVAFRIHERGSEGDIPFFIDLTGMVIPKEGLDEAVERVRGSDPFIVLVCSFPEARSFDLVRPGVRSQFCTPWRAGERQP